MSKKGHWSPKERANLKEDIFEVIDTPEKAYWLGFLYADGYVQTRGYMIALTLSSKDKLHIKEFDYAWLIPLRCWYFAE